MVKIIAEILFKTLRFIFCPDLDRSTAQRNGNFVGNFVAYGGIKLWIAFQIWAFNSGNGVLDEYYCWFLSLQVRAVAGNIPYRYSCGGILWSLYSTSGIMPYDSSFRMNQIVIGALRRWLSSLIEHYWKQGSSNTSPSLSMVYLKYAYCGTPRKV